jgi:hypothetical protein
MMQTPTTLNSAASRSTDIHTHDIDLRSEPMTFKNEYIPPIEQETSEFFKQARETLKTGFSEFDSWTVDRQNDRVLNWSHSGRDYESRNDEGWDYIDTTGRYRFGTRLTSQEELSPNEIAMTRTIYVVWEGNHVAGMPSKETWQHIKEALEIRRDYGVRSKYSACKLTLILDGEAL